MIHGERTSGEAGTGVKPPSRASDSLLASFGGREPDCPAWFAEALALAPTRSRFTVDGAGIELLAWGEVGAPGLLFLHGNGAHADWWSHIAPFFAAERRVAAISWSGMGGSDWRDRYSIPQFARELLVAIDAAQLAAGGSPPLVVGHSFGGMPLIHAASTHPDSIGGAILVDSLLPRPDGRPGWMASGRPTATYPTIAAAIARYRFAPPQPTENLFIVDAIARRSLREVEARGSQAWTWRFDPRLWATVDRSIVDPLVETVRIPIGLIYGEESALVGGDDVARMRARLRLCPFVGAVPKAQHHVMVDQPLALIAALRIGLSALR
jgi:pimeloyl-ACP methyl ester carboxylesterase